MAILAMSLMGILPMGFASSFSLLFLLWHNNSNNHNGKDTGRMPVILMGKMPMLRLMHHALRQLQEGVVQA